MVNDVWSERWWGDWELVLLVDSGHAGEVPVVLPMVLVLVLLVLPVVLVLVLLVYR